MAVAMARPKQMGRPGMRPQQRSSQAPLMPMPMFGQRPVQIVTGQIVTDEAELDGEPVLQGQLERGAPWHESELELPPELKLGRGNTQLLISHYQGMTKKLLIGGLFSTVVFFIECAACIFFSETVPRKCNVDLRVCFLQLGIVHGIMGVTSACFLCVAWTMLSAQLHGAIAQKYRLERRDDEAESEESDYESQADRARTTLKLPTVVHTFAIAALVLLWVHSASQVLNAKEELCADSLQIFWALTLFTLVNLCASTASGRSFLL
eukprot:TRINITY_DN23177_c0_g1_i1.p1 TRINITY_DN23177_c0_g1~~TRINITY_DN23177_c0_g1_i1.p1  ORF type:complete len:265 (-),score=51.67 TRINITY_DN23177_c0_g1_i1:451-1245(-)